LEVLVVRNVVMIRCKPGTTSEDVARLEAALRAIDFPERTNFSMGEDLGLRDGNMSLAILADFPDEDAYRRFDADEEHNRVRQELILPIAQAVERCQYHAP
jgi:Stress responsive A/B Barrel Domain